MENMLGSSCQDSAPPSSSDIMGNFFLLIFNTIFKNTMFYKYFPSYFKFHHAMKFFQDEEKEERARKTTEKQFVILFVGPMDVITLEA